MAGGWPRPRPRTDTTATCLAGVTACRRRLRRYRLSRGRPVGIGPVVGLSRGRDVALAAFWQLAADGASGVGVAVEVEVEVLGVAEHRVDVAEDVLDV